MGAGGSISNNRKFYLSKILEMCVDMQNEIKLHDDSLLAVVAKSKKIMPKTYKKYFKDVIDDLENEQENSHYIRSGKHTLFVLKQPKPLPFQLLTAGLYPVGIAMMGLGIHGLKILNRDNNGSGGASGSGILYFFDVVFIALGTVPIGGATLTIINYAIKKRNYEEYKMHVRELEEIDTLKILEY